MNVFYSLIGSEWRSFLYTQSEAKSKTLFLVCKPIPKKVKKSFSIFDSHFQTRKMNIVFFTGAGVSQESGLATFRDHGGLWEQYKIEDVATPEAWQRNPDLVTHFYNLRRKQLIEAIPNRAHLIIAELETKYPVQVVTQNVDDLHERAGSSKVLHLHGELRKVRSEKYPSLIYHMEDWEVRNSDTCERGARLRPHVVWFGEDVPNMQSASNIVKQANLFVIIGTSLEVYPAAFLIHDTTPDCEIILIDPGKVSIRGNKSIRHIREKAVKGMEILASELLPSR
jgi:NAD-dependent deacetylase